MLQTGHKREKLGAEISTTLILRESAEASTGEKLFD